MLPSAISTETNWVTMDKFASLGLLRYVFHLGIPKVPMIESMNDKLLINFTLFAITELEFDATN